MNKSVKKYNRSGDLVPLLFFLVPAILLVGGVLIWPIFKTVWYSLHEYNLIDRKSEFIGMGNYVGLFKDSEFWHSLLLQFGFIFIALPIELVFGFFMALLLNKDFKGAGLVRTLLLLPVFILPVLSGLTWKFIFTPVYGPLAYIYNLFGAESPFFLADPVLSYIAVLIQDIWRMWPFMFMILYAGLANVSQSLIEAAEVDGASFWKKVFKIYIPILMPTIVTALLLRLIDALRIFSEIFVMTQGGPGNATTLFSIYVHRQAFRYFNIGIACAMSIFLIIISMVFATSIVKRHLTSEHN